MDTLEKIIELLNRYHPIVKYVAGIALLSTVLLVILLVALPRNEQSRILFITDINQLWPPLSKELHTALPGQRRLDLLGLTLYAAWGQLSPWLQEAETRDWEVNIYCLSPAAARGPLASLVPTQWADDAEARTKAIQGFLQEYKADLAARNVKLTLHHYRSFPAVHGYMLGNGKIYMSLTRWSLNTGKLEYGAHPYEIVMADDQGERAKAYRAAFLNWLQRAKKG